MCADLVRIAWHLGGDFPAGQHGAAEAVLEDISALGACVQTEDEIPVGAGIQLSSGEHTLSGVVSYSVFRDYGYFAGIRFSDQTHWSSGVFVPQHLTNLQSLGPGNGAPEDAREPAGRVRS